MRPRPCAAVAEVGHHLRREAVATGKADLSRTYRTYAATIAGTFLKLRGQSTLRPDIYDPAQYAASQGFGESVRSSGGQGVLYDSLRHAGGVNVVAFRTHDILDVVQTDHYEITVESDNPRIIARKVAA